MINHEQALDNFQSQIEFAINNYKPHLFNNTQISNIVICGLGGSGIGGRIAKSFAGKSLPLPIEVVSDYNLPLYANNRTLVILSSYSGTTEETLSMFRDAERAGCAMIVITSGGDLLQMAKNKSLTVYKVPEGYQPRMALGFSLTYNLLILSELLGVDGRQDILAAMGIYKEKEMLKMQAQNLIQQVKNTKGSKFVVVCDNNTEAIAVRFCQQIQENAKSEAFITVLPEANHNVLESYYSKLDTNFVFLNSNTNTRNNGRFGYLRQILLNHGNLITEIKMKDFSLNEILKAIYIMDWVSIYLSDLKGENNMEVNNISGLKQYLKDLK